MASASHFSTASLVDVGGLSVEELEAVPEVVEVAEVVEGEVEGCDAVEEGSGVAEELGILGERWTIAVGSQFRQTDDPERYGRV